MRKTWLIVSLILLCSYNNFSQRLFFQSFTSINGLSQNSIYCITQTKDGFMWFGTQDGLNRFDGKTFVQINPKINQHYEKVSKMITALFADSDDMLWVGTTTELILYNRYLNIFENPSSVYTGFNLPRGIWINKIAEDKKGNIWILTQKNGLFCYSKKMKIMKPIMFNSVSLQNIIAFCFDQNFNVITSTEESVYKVEYSDFSALHVNRIPIPSNTEIKDLCFVNHDLWILLNTSEVLIMKLENDHVTNCRPIQSVYSSFKRLPDTRILHQSDSNTVWFGSRTEGLLKLNLSENKIELANSLIGSNSLKTSFVLSFFTDHQNITWVGLSGGGVAKYTPHKVQFELFRNEASPSGAALDNMFFSIYSDNDKDFYIGTLTKGLLHVDVNTKKYHYYLPTLNSKPEGVQNIYEIIKGEKNLLWMASWGGLLSFDTKTKLFNCYFDKLDKQTQQLYTVLKLEKENKILVSGYEGGLRLFNIATQKWEKCADKDRLLENEQLKLRVRYMRETGNGNILMSTEAHNLICYNYLKGEFILYPPLQKISNASRFFCIDGQYLWIATDDGLIQARHDTKQIIKLWSKIDGLPNNYIYAIQTDHFGNLWLSTNEGISMLDYKKGICTNFTEKDGLQSMEFNTACCLKDKNENLWFGGINGMNKVIPKNLVSSTFSPSPLMTNINVMNAPLESDSSVTYIHSFELPYFRNFVSFEFQSPNNAQSENIIYQFKLDGVDTGWIDNGTRNFVNYTQLKPGMYLFEVRSANASFIWSKPTTVSFRIYPPWYNTWWFYFILLAASSTTIYLFVKQRIENLKIKMQAKQKIVEMEMAALKAQMNPHFMFNCINSIDAFIYNNDKYNATLYLNKFAKLLRNVLESSKHNLVPLSKDIETLKLYIELEQIRSDHKFKWVFNINKELLNAEFKVPPLIIQPFVENAIIHGLRNRIKDDGELIIDIDEQLDFLVYTIKDNGIGRKASKNNHPLYDKSSFGIQITTDRIKFFNNEAQASFEIYDRYPEQEETGTVVKVKLKKQ